MYTTSLKRNIIGNTTQAVKHNHEQQSIIVHCNQHSVCEVAVPAVLRAPVAN